MQTNQLSCTRLKDVLMLLNPNLSLSESVQSTFILKLSPMYNMVSNCPTALICSMCANSSIHLNLLDYFNHSKIFNTQWKLWHSTVCNFLLFTNYSSLLGPNSLFKQTKISVLFSQWTMTANQTLLLLQRQKGNLNTCLEQHCLFSARLGIRPRETKREMGKKGRMRHWKNQRKKMWYLLCTSILTITVSHFTFYVCSILNFTITFFKYAPWLCTTLTGSWTEHAQRIH